MSFLEKSQADSLALDVAYLRGNVEEEIDRLAREAEEELDHALKRYGIGGGTDPEGEDSPAVL